MSKKTSLEQRYSASGKLGDSIEWSWIDIGYLWLLSEYEVFGSVIWGTKNWSAGQAVQYPIFANSYKNRIKGAGMNGEKCRWWLLTTGGNSYESACGVHTVGTDVIWPVIEFHNIPICFRIAAQH